jgi:Tfp pilus assembly protein PilW
MVIGLIIILGMMSLYVSTNIRNLALLKRELQLIEQKQIEHWRK